MLVLTSSDLVKLLDMPSVITVVEEAHRALSTGHAVQPERESLQLGDCPSLLVPMTAGIEAECTAGVKLMSDTPSNREQGLPRQQSAILLSSAQTGRIIGLVDGGAVTKFRTAAASAVATNWLANRGEIDCLGLIGAGTQARSHLEAIMAVRPVNRVVVWTRSQKSASAFLDDTQEYGIEIEVAESPESVVTNADVLCTLTPSEQPIVNGRWFKAGMHVNAVGAPPRVDYREIDTEGIQKSTVIVDSKVVAQGESGDVMIPYREGAIDLDHFSTELGDVIAKQKPGRSSADEITLYNSVGLPIQDVATAILAMQRAREQGIGQEIQLSA